MVWEKKEFLYIYNLHFIDTPIISTFRNNDLSIMSMRHGGLHYENDRGIFLHMLIMTLSCSIFTRPSGLKFSCSETRQHMGLRVENSLRERNILRWRE
jgi:hypothetical protein